MFVGLVDVLTKGKEERKRERRENGKFFPIFFFCREKGNTFPSTKTNSKEAQHLLLIVLFLLCSKRR